MGRLFLVDLEGSSYSCKHCRTPLALKADVISKFMPSFFSLRCCGVDIKKVSRKTDCHVLVNLGKYFCSRNRRAYLFYNVENVTCGPREDRMMITGMHTVVDIYCVGCGSILGWKYIYAYEKAHKYKEGWFLVERCKVLSPAGTPYVANQEAQDGQQARNGQETWMAQEAQDGQQARNGQETWMAQEAQAGGGIDVDNA